MFIWGEVMSYECGCLPVPGEGIRSPGDGVSGNWELLWVLQLNTGPLKQSKLLSCFFSHLSKFFWNSK